MSKDIYKYKILSLIIIMGLLITIPFFIRNIIQSGYLIYPFPDIDIFNVDWKIPLANTISEKAYIELWAIKPGPMLPFDSLSFFERASIWWENLGHLKDFYIQVVLVFFVMILSELYRIFIKKDIKIRDFISLYPVIITLLSLISLWFFTAPGYRFLFTPFHFIIALSIARTITNFININSIIKYIEHNYKFRKIVAVSQKVILTISVIVAILLFVLTYLGNYERIGYFDTFKLEESDDNFKYSSSMKFNDKIFKRNDIFSILTNLEIVKEKYNINGYIGFNTSMAYIILHTTEKLKDDYKIVTSYRCVIKTYKVLPPLLLLLLLLIILKGKNLSYIKLKAEYFIISCIFLIMLFSIQNKIIPATMYIQDIKEVKHENIGKYYLGEGYNPPLPTAPYKISDKVYLRGDTLKDGFKRIE